MVNMILNSKTSTLQIDKVILRGVISWDRRKPYPECIQTVKELRKGNAKISFPSHVLMDDILIHRWREFTHEIENFIQNYTPTPCKEWIVYGSEGRKIGTTVQFSEEGWTAIVDGIPKEIVEEYNEIVKSGENAALFIRDYNNGEGLPEVQERAKRIIVTPSKGGTVVVRNFLRENGKIGEVHRDTRIVVRSGDNTLPNEMRRVVFTVLDDDFYAGPIVRGYANDQGRYFVGVCSPPLLRLGAVVQSNSY